jgi:elongation factor Ts
VSEVSAKQVHDLRKMSGAGMMDCKNALSESAGDLDAAFKWLREKGIAKAEKKSSRDANEGLVGIKSGDKGSAVVEINSETDFVSRNGEFQSLVNNILDIAIKGNNNLKDETSELISSSIAKIGENIVFKRSEFIEGNTHSYIHNKIADGLGKIGVLIKFKKDDGSLKEIGKNLCMHIAASSPRSLSESDLDAKIIEDEKNIIKEQLKDSGKSDNIIEKMIDGKIKKFYEEVVLLNQKYVMDPSVSVNNFLKSFSEAKGKDIQIDKFIRFELGE